ncbi:MAG: hypothetical protein P9M03_13320 [Candidatus Theseobacter exili]|nr:hypothetical protein [Candidatus Theseobacter exili]
MPSRFAHGILGKHATERIVFWSAGNQMLKDDPIFGVGYNMFGEYCYSRAAQSSFVECYSELGFLGYFFWIGLIFVALYGLWTLKDKIIPGRAENDKFHAFMCDGILAAIAGYMAAGFFLSRAFMLHFYLLIAVSARLRFLSTNGEWLAGDIINKFFVKRIALIAVASILAIHFLAKVLWRFY